MPLQTSPPGPRFALLPVLFVLLAGCTQTLPHAGPGADPADGTKALPLPPPILDQKDAQQWLARPPRTDCSSRCIDYPLNLPRAALIDARLTSLDGPRPMSFTLRRGPDYVDSRELKPGDPRTTLTFNQSIYEATSNLTLRVVPAGGFALNISFHELPVPGAGVPVHASPGFGPHVIIGIPDTGINPYHAVFYRPNLTQHPCTYIRNFPCDVKELRLHVGEANWKEAFAKDEATWKGLERGAWYWIPQTVFVAVQCKKEVLEPDPVNGRLFGELCIMDEGGAFVGHGTGTTSILIMQNPDAYIAFHEGPEIEPFVDEGIPVDVYSVSWANRVPYPYPSAVNVDALPCGAWKVVPIFVKGAGNDPRLAAADCQSAPPHVISVGGGYTEPRAHTSESANMADVESYFCPPFAAFDSVADIEAPGTWCGTSFSTPTVAGSLGKAILEVRRASGYDGNLTSDAKVDPILGISVSDLRRAMERTATYTPTPDHAFVDLSTQVPLNPGAPWLQWGWGFYDSHTADLTAQHLLGTKVAADKPEPAKSYMESQQRFRELVYG